MKEAETGMLEQVLLDLNTDQLGGYKAERIECLGPMKFSEYYLKVLEEHQVKRAEAIANSGIEVHYAYQILNGEKNGKRDKLICLCIGGGFTLQETQRALERAAEGNLYAKRMRDAVIMTALNQGTHVVWKVNELLAHYGEELLK